MKQFIIKSALLSGMVLFSLFAVIYLLPVNPNLYLAATIDKHRLLRETPQPRIILAGDSNIAYGLNSARIKEATGYNIINMGLHGGLGMRYYLEELTPYLRKDDVVIIIPEYQNYFFDGSGANTLVEITIFNPRVILSYSRKTLHSFIASVPLAFQRRLKGAFSDGTPSGNMTLARTAFNEFGDNVGHLNTAKPKFLTVERPMPKKVNDDLVALFNEFYDTWTPRGVRIFLTYSPMIIQNRAKQEKALAEISADMKARIRIPQFGDPFALMYPPELFYDNIFHLDGRGRELRTTEMIAAMKKVPLLARAPEGAGASERPKKSLQSRGAPQ